jgi:hypothetical protein
MADAERQVVGASVPFLGLAQVFGAERIELNGALQALPAHCGARHHADSAPSSFVAAGCMSLIRPSQPSSMNLLGCQESRGSKGD